MKTTWILTGFGALALAGALFSLAACGTTMPSKELVAARNAYSTVAHGKAQKLVPDKVLTAKQALDRAEAAFKNNPGSFKERSLAYVAERKAEIAAALADQAEAKATLSQAGEAYSSEQDKLRLAEKKSLEENQRHLKQVRARLAQQNNKLSAESNALKQQEQKLEAERQALQKEHAAREAAEKKYAAAMESLQQIAKVQQKKRGMVITLSGSVLFTTNKADLLAIAKLKLAKVAEVLQEQDPSKKIVVYGYTDSIGTKAHNQKLSQARADNVRTFLVQKGVDASRISAVGRGEEDPVASNRTPEGRADNRRVEIVVH